MSKFMHPVLKNKLLTALQSAVGEVNDKRSDYVTAVSKAAQDHQLNPNQTIRLCEMFNRVRALNQYQKDGEKAADYAVVDPQAVLARMTEVAAPGNVGGQKVANDALLAYHEYTQPETRFEHGAARPGHEKASAATDTDTEPVTWGATAENRARAALTMLRERRQQIEKAASMSNMLLTRCGLLVDTVAREIVGQGEQAAVESLTRLGRLYQVGRNEFGLLRSVADRIPESLTRQVTREKLAEVRVPVVLNKDQERWNTMLEAVHGDREQSVVLGVWADSEKRAADEDYGRLMGLFRAPTGNGPVQDAAASLPSAPLSRYLAGESRGKAPGREPAKKPSGDGKARESFILSHAAGVFPDYQSVARQLLAEGPGARAEAERDAQQESYANLDREAVLSELMLTDPILREADEDKILRAYRGLISMSPDLTRNKELVRSMLRQAVKAEGISPYDAQAFTTLEKSMRGLELPNTTQPSRAPVAAATAPAESGGKDRR